MSDNEKENTVNNDAQNDTLNISPDIDTETPEPKKKSMLHEIVSWTATIVGAILLAYIITTFVIVNAEVPTESMENTIEAGDRLVAFRLSYLFEDPERYDIVVFKYPEDVENVFIK